MLGLREHYLKRNQYQHTVPDPDTEREAWKQHIFNSYKRDVNSPHVWQNISRGTPADPALGAPPSDEEFAECGKQMKNGKAAGGDGFLAEFYKYGSPMLRDQIHTLVRRMWQQAANSHPGEEAVQWPQAWNTGTVVPLWKKKGSPQDKNTYRGITLLSVGSKPGFLHVSGSNHTDTMTRKSRGYRKIYQTAKAWHFVARASHKKLPHSFRIRIMKAIVMPTLTSFGRSRAWNREQIKQLQMVVNWAVQRCLLIARRWKPDNHVNIYSQLLNELAQWEPFETTIARQSLLWLGHVARMDKSRLPKQALFGFWQNHTVKPHAIQTGAMATILVSANRCQRTRLVPVGSGPSSVETSGSHSIPNHENQQTNGNGPQQIDGNPPEGDPHMYQSVFPVYLRNDIDPCKQMLQLVVTNVLDARRNTTKPIA